MIRVIDSDIRDIQYCISNYINIIDTLGEVMEIWSFGKACVSPLTSSACTVTLRGQQHIQQNYGTYLKKDR